MHNPFENDSAMAVHQMALGMVMDERLRQVSVKGYTVEHDDTHQAEELAAAAAFYLHPAMFNPDVCVAEDNSLLVVTLIDLIGQAAWQDIERTDTDHYLNDAASLALRIDTVKTGLALGLAELERLLRLRAKTASGAA